MEFFMIYRFFININHQSIKLILKNGKLMASTSIITHSLLSILTFSFIISIRSLHSNMINSVMKPYTVISPATNPASNSPKDTFLQHILIYMTLLLLVEFGFIFLFGTISYIYSVAAILISAVSYTGKNISSQDLFSMIAKKWKRPWITGVRGSRSQPARYSVLVIFLVIVLSVMYPNILTISMSVLFGIIAAIFVMYSSVSWILAMVVSVLEEGCYGKEALERGEQLGKGHRVDGFLLNVFLNLLALIPFLGYWWILGEKGLLDFPCFGLFMVNIFSLVNMLGMVEFTVLYFECKKYHGEEIEVFGDLQYTKVPSDEEGV